MRRTLANRWGGKLPALLAFTLLASCAQAQQHELRIAAASDLQPVLPALATAYEHATGIHLVPSFGSSATLTEQLRNGAPFDLFLSADLTHPQQLTDAHLTTAAPVPYAQGTLVLWARKDSPAQPLALDSFAKSTVTRIAIANPAHAPYGLAAQQYLQHAHLDAQLAPKLVTAENIAQTAQFAESGNAQLSFLSLTSASTPHFRDLGTYVLIPKDSYAPIVQAAVILKSAHHLAEAQAFLAWLTSPTTQTTLRQYGLDPAR